LCVVCSHIGNDKGRGKKLASWRGTRYCDVVRSTQEVWDGVHFPGYFRVQIRGLLSSLPISLTSSYTNYIHVPIAVLSALYRLKPYHIFCLLFKRNQALLKTEMIFFFYMTLQPLLPWQLFQFLIPIHIRWDSLDRIGTSQGHYLHIGQHKQNKSAQISMA
jgi:hypothetical protein